MQMYTHNAVREIHYDRVVNGLHVIGECYEVFIWKYPCGKTSGLSEVNKKDIEYNQTPLLLHMKYSFTT